MNISVGRTQTILLFSILFILVGTVAPIAYVQLAPQDEFIEVHEFSVEDTHTEADSHSIYFDRTVKRPSNAEITVEMILLKEDGTQIEQDTFTVDAYYQQGSGDIIVNREIRLDSVEPGKYKYIHSVDFRYYGGLSTRNFVFESETFTVYENESDIPPQPEPFY